MTEGELDPAATIRKFRIVRREGEVEVARLIEHYNLDAIPAIGHRVRPPRGVLFRRWATERLSKYLVKGFTMDDQRLKNHQPEVRPFPTTSTNCQGGPVTYAPARNGCPSLIAS